MAIGEKLKESVCTYSSSSSSTSTSLFQSISAELHRPRRCPPTCANSSESNPFSLPNRESWWGLFRPTCSTTNSPRVHHPSRHSQSPYHHKPTRHQPHHLRLNSLSLHLTVVLLVTTLFASFPSPVGSAKSSSSWDENEKLNCLEGTSPAIPGATFPRGDIYLKEGETLEVFCKLNLTISAAKGYNASNIDFKFTMGEIHRDQVETTVLDEATAMVRVRNMNASYQIVQCLVKKPSERPIVICQNEIHVGFPPLAVEDFRCVVMAWRSLNCTWKLPTNPVPTKYTLVKLLKRGEIPCPNNTVTPTTCTWGPRTEPHYMQNVDPIKLRLNGTNKLKPSGFWWDYSFSLGSIIIPEKPAEIQLRKKSAVVYMVNWTFPNYEYFQPGLEHQLSVCSEYDEKCNVTEIRTFPVESKMTPYFVTDTRLPYAYTEYTIKVRLRSIPSNRTEEFWSEWSTNTVLTDAQAPVYPPETDVGSFYKEKVNNLGRIYIYWKSIPNQFKNGPGLKYQVSVFDLESERELSIKPDVVSESYAKFERLNLHSSYRFFVSAANSRGRSVNSSEITVPAIDKLPQEPKSVSRLDFTNGSFEISWKRPDRYSEIVSYTVFSCASKRPRPYLCEGPVEWDRVGATSSESDTMRKFYNFGKQPTDHLYQFAVSANTNQSGSGMVWATCTLIHNEVPRKLRVVRLETISEEQIVIRWDLECSYQSGDIEGFKIDYCQVEKDPGESCKDDESSVAVEGASVTTYRLLKLKPYSVYKVYVTILSAAGQSKRSDPVSARTLQGAPSQARISGISQVTNVSATLHIESPADWNGQLQDYRVYYWSAIDPERDFRVELRVSNDTLSFTEEVTLNNLTSNTNYSVYVIACTNKCSERSAEFSFVTDIGRTDLNSFPKMTLEGGHMVISWWLPGRQGGPIDHFQIMYESNGKQLTTETEYSSVNFTKDTVQYRHESDYTCEPGTNFTAQIRAVTKLNSGQYLFGAWSPPGNYKCGGGVSWVIWLILVFVAIAGVIFIGYLTVRFYHYFRHMKEVPIKLPPGLNTELNGFTHKPPPRGRSNDQSTNFSYPLQPTSTHSDESKDFLSSSDLNQGEAEESLIEKPNCPSPTNPLLGGLHVSANLDGSNLDDDEQDIRLSEFNSIRSDRCSSPTYKKLGVLGNGSAISIEPTPGPSSRSSPSNSALSLTTSPSHINNTQIGNHSNPSSFRVEPSTSNGINRTVPDVLSSSPSTPTSLNSISLPAQAPPPPLPVAPAPPSSSYVKWTTLVPDMKTGEAGSILENGNRQSPYCQVGILLDS